MRREVNKSVFNSLMKKLDIQQPKSEKENFNDWMRDKVKSVHYANNESMITAFSKIEEKNKLLC